MAKDLIDKLTAFTEAGDTLDRIDLAATVAAMCAGLESSLSQKEALIVFDIIQQLYIHVEHRARKILAERLCERADVPHDLIRFLANDTIDIARPVLLASPILTDCDLCDITRNCSLDHCLALCQRPSLSVEVCDALLNLGNDRIMIRLGGNEGADFSDQGWQRLLSRSRAWPELRDLLAERSDLTTVLVETLAAMTEDHIGAQILEKAGSKMAMTLRHDLTASAREAARAEIIRHAASSGSRRTPEWPLLESIRAGDIAQVEQELHGWTGFPSHATSRILFSRDGSALAVICKALGMSLQDFSEVYSRLHGMPPYGTSGGWFELATANGHFARLSRKQAETLLTGWKENPESIWGDASAAPTH